MLLGWFDDGPRPAAENMRRDRALLRCAEAGRPGHPLLVVYRWRPAAVSLGFHQSEADLDRKAVEAAGLAVVRRPTGGAAVLHDEELTYALVGALGVPGLGRTVASIYEAVARSLVEVLRNRGVDATRGGGGRPSGFACFGQSGGHEITVGHRKLVGSALRKGRRAFLLHGSLLTGSGHLELARFERGGDDGREGVDRRRRDLAARTTDLGALGLHAGEGGWFGEELARALARRIQAEPRRLSSLPACVGEEMTTDARRDSESQAGAHR